jgi:hypothetical protein
MDRKPKHHVVARLAGMRVGDARFIDVQQVHEEGGSARRRAEKAITRGAAKPYESLGVSPG